MRFESFEEIIHYAIEKEKEAAAFYEDAASQEAYSGAKKLFDEFAGEAFFLLTAIMSGCGLLLHGLILLT